MSEQWFLTTGTWEPSGVWLDEAVWDPTFEGVQATVLLGEQTVDVLAQVAVVGFLITSFLGKTTVWGRVTPVTDTAWASVNPSSEAIWTPAAP